MGSIQQVDQGHSRSSAVRHQAIIREPTPFHKDHLVAVPGLHSGPLLSGNIEYRKRRQDFGSESDNEGSYSDETEKFNAVNSGDEATDSEAWSDCSDESDYIRLVDEKETEGLWPVQD